jgi:hypothetical protein
MWISKRAMVEAKLSRLGSSDTTRTLRTTGSPPPSGATMSTWLNSEAGTSQLRSALP